MNINESFLVGVDISDGKDLSVVSVFKRNVDKNGNVNLKCVNTFYGEEAEKFYDNLVFGGTNDILSNGGTMNEIENSI
jgi:hypothetical protein